MRNGMMLFTVFTAFVLAGTDLPGLTAQQSEFKTVTMIGCLAEEDDRWVLTNATEPSRDRDLAAHRLGEIGRRRDRRAGARAASISSGWPPGTCPRTRTTRRK